MPRRHHVGERGSRSRLPCSGIAGAGATALAVGEGACLTGGQTMRLDAGSIDLGQVRVVESDLLQGVDQQVRAAFAPVLDQALPAIADGARTALAGLGEPGLHLGLGALQSWCAAEQGATSGGARLAGATAYARVGERRVDLLTLPVDPAPDTQVATGLDEVATLVLETVRSQVRTTVGDTLVPSLLPTGQLPTGQLPSTRPWPGCSRRSSTTWSPRSPASSGRSRTTC